VSAVYPRASVANAGGSIGRQWAAEFVTHAAFAGVLFEGEGRYSAGELINAELPGEASAHHT
jgi:hypothetical protein